MLNICKKFFEELNFSGIRYCHWKSNSHLDKALDGKTDLDILIHPDEKNQFERTCEKFKIIRILSPFLKSFPDIEDYLGFDYDTGRLIHLHIHYRLILGQKYIKNHHIPIENIIFNYLTKKYNVYIPAPEVELILLIIRAHMKLDIIELVKNGIRELQRQHWKTFPADIENEMAELIDCCDSDKLNIVLSEFNFLLPEVLFKDFIKKFTANKYTCYNSFKNRSQIFSSLKGFMRNKGGAVHLKYCYQLFINSHAFRKLIVPKNKTFPGDGRIFSLVGADGSGKSSLINDLENWCSWKLNVKVYYYGIPKNLSVKFFDLIIRGGRKLNIQSLVFIGEVLLWLFVAKTRYKVFLSSQKDRSNGKVVFTDRFPLKEFHSMETPMDGPRLKSVNSKIMCYLSRKEKSLYNKITEPDRIFLLKVNIGELRSRKKDLDLSNHIIKKNIVNSIKETRTISIIDANKPYNDVVLCIKRKIWEAL